MALAPIDYGGPVQADTQGVGAMEQANASHEAVFQEARQLGANVEGGAQQIAQGILHSQALKATAAVKERQASTLSFIESNPYVPKAVLQQRMSPEDYAAWSAGIGGSPEWKDKAAVPMYTVAGALFDSEAKQARSDAGQLISLPGWRGNWAASEQTESATIRERYVNRVAADQLIADRRQSTLASIDSMMDSALNKGDFSTPAKAAETSPVLSPPERRVVANKVRVAQDSFDAEQAMRKQDVPGMEQELIKLRGDHAADYFPSMNEKQRLDLTQRLEREYGFHAARSVAAGIVSKFVDQQGKVDSVGLANAIAGYQGPNKEEVVKATQAQESETQRIFDAKASSIQSQVFTAGQNPQTGEFSMARANANSDAAKAVDWLHKNDPTKLDALAQRDIRRQRWEDIKDRQAANAEKMQQTQASHDNLEQIRDLLYDEKNWDYLRTLSPAQWDSQLHEVNGGLNDADMDKARKEFVAFQARGGKGDERVTTSVAAEIKAAAGGDNDKSKKLMAKYGTQLTRIAHDYIRTNPSTDPGKLTDGVRAAVKAELLSGTVVDGGRLFGDATARRIDWETNPSYAGKQFKTQEGAVLDSKQQRALDTRPSMTIGGETRYWDGKAWVE